MHQISNPTLNTTNKICEATAKLTAVKLLPNLINVLLFILVNPISSPTQFQTLQILKNDPTIIIKPADKGGATVVLSTHLYIG